MPSLYLPLALALAGLLTGSILTVAWPLRSRLSSMTGMMIAMTAGMLTGLIVGTGAPLLLGSNLWPATLLGVLVGLSVGALTGAPFGLLAVLDGGLAGLMGGMMGAMLGVMAPEAIGPAVLLLLCIYLLAGTALLRHASREAGSSPRLSWAFLLPLLVALALLGGWAGALQA